MTFPDHLTLLLLTKYFLTYFSAFFEAGDDKQHRNFVWQLLQMNEKFPCFYLSLSASFPELISLDAFYPFYREDPKPYHWERYYRDRHICVSAEASRNSIIDVINNALKRLWGDNLELESKKQKIMSVTVMTR